MKYIIALFALAATSASAMADTTGTATTTSTGQGTSVLNYSPVTTNEAPYTRPNTVIAPSINPTVQCAGTSSGGVAFAGVQIAGGGSRIDKVCQDMEAIKMTYVMQDRDAALEMECAAFPAYREARLKLYKRDPNKLPCLDDLPADWKHPPVIAIAPAPAPAPVIAPVPAQVVEPIVIAPAPVQESIPVPKKKKKWVVPAPTVCK